MLKRLMLMLTPLLPESCAPMIPRAPGVPATPAAPETAFDAAQSTPSIFAVKFVLPPVLFGAATLSLPQPATINATTRIRKCLERAFIGPPGAQTWGVSNDTGSR